MHRRIPAKRAILDRRISETSAELETAQGRIPGGSCDRAILNSADRPDQPLSQAGTGMAASALVCFAASALRSAL